MRLPTRCLTLDHLDGTPAQTWNTELVPDAEGGLNPPSPDAGSAAAGGASHPLYPEKGKAFVGPPRQLEAEQKPRGRSREHAHRPGWQRNSKRSVDAPEDAVERKTLQGAGTEPYRSTVPVSLTDSDTPSPGARQAESGVASSSSSTWSEYEAPHSAKKAVRRRPRPSDRQASPRRRLLGHTVQ